ncbi:MAG: hypothetical protein KAT65_03145 [Methanophagales archaeon]|nr:hypothetical protein [Methanophagales archaeon]
MGVDEVESGRKVYKAYENFICDPKYKEQEKKSILLLNYLFGGKIMQGEFVKKDITLDCSIDRFVNIGIPEAYAIVLLSELHHCTCNSNFKFVLTTERVFGDNNTKGFEEGNISCPTGESIWEPPKWVENGGICIAFLFFSNVMSIKSWMAVPRRGKGYDYSCLDLHDRKIVVEVCGRTGKYGARKGLSDKKIRFQRLGTRTEPTYISSMGFREGEHIVHKYN